MFKAVRIRTNDTCLTYVLKRINLIDKFKDVDGSDFSKLFTLIPITSFDDCSKGDVIVVNKNKKLINIISHIDAVGRTSWSKYDISHHYMLFEGSMITDLGVHGIMCHKLDYFNFTKYQYYRIPLQLVKEY